MKKIITILVAVTIATLLYYMGTGSGEESTKMQREVGSFHGILVSSGINIIISDSVNNVTVETAANKQEYVETTVKDGVLHVWIENNNLNLSKLQFKHICVYVPMQEYSQLHTKSGSSISMQEMMTTKDLTITAENGSNVEANLNCINLSVDTNSGSNVDLSGKCSKLNLETSSGASFSSFDMVAQIAFCNSSSGSTVKVNVAKDIHINTTSGSSIRYKGDCTVKLLEQSSGGTYNRVK